MWAVERNARDGSEILTRLRAPDETTTKVAMGADDGDDGQSQKEKKMKKKMKRKKMKEERMTARTANAVLSGEGNGVKGSDVDSLWAGGFPEAEAEEAAAAAMAAGGDKDAMIASKTKKKKTKTKTKKTATAGRAPLHRVYRVNPMSSSIPVLSTPGYGESR